MQLVIRLPARRIALILGGIALYLCVQSLVGKAVEYELGTHSTYFIYQFVMTLALCGCSSRERT
jgi:hypothetical protein